MSRERNKKKRRKRLGASKHPRKLTRNSPKFIEQDGLCFYCKVPMLVNGEACETHPQRATRDHIIPICQMRGKNKNMNGKNVVLSCFKCNTTRGHKCHPIAKDLKAQLLIERKTSHVSR